MKKTLLYFYVIRNIGITVFLFFFQLFLFNEGKIGNLKIILIIFLLVVKNSFVFIYIYTLILYIFQLEI